MKYSDYQATTEKLLVREELAESMVESSKLFQDMQTARWIKPVVSKHKCKLYKVSDIKLCVERLALEGYPEAEK